jgi:hypothetical protein
MKTRKESMVEKTDIRPSDRGWIAIGEWSIPRVFRDDRNLAVGCVDIATVDFEERG